MCVCVCGQWIVWGVDSLDLWAQSCSSLHRKQPLGLISVFLLSHDCDSDTPCWVRTRARKDKHIPGIWSYLEYGTIPVKVNPSSFLSGGAPKYSILQIINLVLLGLVSVLVGVDHYFEQFGCAEWQKSKLILWVGTHAFDCLLQQMLKQMLACICCARTGELKASDWLAPTGCIILLLWLCLVQLAWWIFSVYVEGGIIWQSTGHHSCFPLP